MKSRVNPYTAAPNAMKALMSVETYIEKSRLEAQLVDLIKTRVSQINGCAYCLHMHAKEALQRGESDKRLFLLDAWRESNLYAPRERAALAWAESLTRIAETHAPDDFYEDVRQHFSDKELADLSVAITMINAWNRIAIGSRLQHPADRVRAAA